MLRCAPSSITRTMSHTSCVACVPQLFKAVRDTDDNRGSGGFQIGRFKGVRTLHPLLATICTPIARPVVAAVRPGQGRSATPPACPIPTPAS